MLIPSTFLSESPRVYAYAGGDADKLSFVEGNILDIIDRSTDRWGKAGQGGEVFLSAAHLVVV